MAKTRREPGEDPDASEGDPEESLPRMSLGEHLDELRRRLMRAVAVLALGIVVAFFFHAKIWEFVRQPFDEALGDTGAPGGLQVVGPVDGFLSSMKLAFLAALVGTSPYVLAQLWGFVAAGLYPGERQSVRVFFPISLLLFAIGCAFAFLIVLPIGMRFLIRWNEHMGATSAFAVGEYVSMCLALLFGLGLAFQLPLVMLFLEATGIVQRETFAKQWRIAVLTAFVLAMVLTPDTSPVSMTLVAIPLVGLYFLGVWGGRFVGDEKEPFRPWHVWPLLLLAGGMVVLFCFRRDLGTWAGRLFT